jgi:hypothetical protein
MPSQEKTRIDRFQEGVVRVHYLSYGEEFNRKALSDPAFPLSRATPTTSHRSQIEEVANTEFRVSRRGTKPSNCFISGTPRTIG